MSKGKLTYESNEPAFLRRLKGEVAGSGGDPDRHARPIARPRLKRDEDDEDAPTYVVEESGDTLSKADYEAMLAKLENASAEDGESAPKVVSEADGDKQVPADTSKQTVAEVGNSSKKRKAGKVIGSDEAGADEGEDNGKKTAKKNVKKKSKAVKLSFDND